uniref:CAZy families GH38 protein n=1 Tax=uncultured Parabacteroides sp. TaxID=512312 RepID=A0A060CIT1_9BACT|nr:CAZy families GH38 protein [uncultured Parabacteroides sp.]
MYKLVSLKNILFIVCVAAMGKVFAQSSQQTYFIDGFHGGIWGHFPYQYSSFMAKQMIDNPDWKINLEIEPVTWDSIEPLDPSGYRFFVSGVCRYRFRFKDRICQSYLWTELSV